MNNKCNAQFHHEAEIMVLVRLINTATLTQNSVAGARNIGKLWRERKEAGLPMAVDSNLVTEPEIFMNVNWKKKGTVLLIELIGRMDTTIPKEFEAQLFNKIASGETHLVFDFSQVEHVTTHGLRMLLQAFKEVTAVNGRMVFHSLNERVRHVFEIGGLTMAFSIYDTREDAVAGALFTGMLPINILNNFNTINQAQ